MTALAQILLVLAGLIVPLDISTDHVDFVELNHVYDDYGRCVLSQLIFWEWCSKSDRFQVVDWKGTRPEVKVLNNEVLFYDRGLRVVRYKWFCESWGQVDVEVNQRSIRPPEKRRKLESNR
jgi:hypothetical protein